MTFLKAVPSVVGVALLAAVFSPGLRADAWDKTTVITFSGPVEIPGVHLKGWAVLPAGTYVFKVLESGSDRHIVQISSKDELTVYATILAIPNLRLKATDKTVMTFSERPAGQPEALRAWFYPGKEWGEEFVYPKSRAIQLAKETNTPVLFTPVEITPEVVVPIKSPAEPVVVELKKAPVMAIQPTGEEVQIAEVVIPPPTETFVAAAPPPVLAELPATASSTPLIALFGVLALAGAGILSSVRKRAL